MTSSITTLHPQTTPSTLSSPTCYSSPAHSLIHMQYLPEKHARRQDRPSNARPSKDKRSGIESDPNRIDDQGYIVRLVGQVITVSVETVKLVNALVQAVRVEDWMGEAVEIKE